MKFSSSTTMLVTKPITRVCISIDGIEKKLFSLKVGKGGEIIIGINSGSKFQYSGLNSDIDFSIGDEALDGSKITGHHYSIHPSNKSPLDLTTINYTMGFEGKENIKLYSEYLGLRSGGAAELYYHSASRKASDKYNIRKKKEITEAITIANVNPRKQQFFYGVLVGRQAASKIIMGSTKYSFKRFNVGEFSIFVVWCFLNLPSIETGKLIQPANRGARVGEGPHIGDIGPRPGFAYADSRNRILGRLYI